MGEFIISLGLLNKQLLIPLIYLISQILNSIILSLIPEEAYNPIISTYESAIGGIIAGLLIKFFYRNRHKKKTQTKQKFLYVFLLFLLDFFYHAIVFVYSYFLGWYGLENWNILTSIYTIELIATTLITIFFLKYKYYRHHIISLIFFSILSIVIDVILKSFSSIEYKYIYIDVIYIIDDVLYFCYIKYMMYNLYYQYWNIVLIDGTSDLITLTFFTGICSLIDYLKDIDGIIYNINFYFTNTDILYLILQFFYFLFYGALLHVLSLLAVHYFTPNYVVVCNELVGIANVIIQSKNLNKWVSLFLFVLIILSLSFYLEILEYNFCGLNQNTKKNIQERIEKQNEAKEIEESVKKDIVDLPFGYTINMEKSNKEIEMRTYSEEVLEKENKESEYDSNIEEGDMKNEKLSYKNDT